MRERLRLAIFISGGGSTMDAIVRATQQDGQLNNRIEPVVVISNKPDASGISKAQALDIPVRVVDRKDFEKGEKGLEQFGWAILAFLREFSADFISQNSWLALTPANVIQEYEGKIFNQHPGPLDPDHKGSDGLPLHFGGKGMHGLAVHAAVLEFQRISSRSFPAEATIHRVNPVVDEGVVVARNQVKVFSGDSPESLARRVLPYEHELQIEFWKGVSDGVGTEYHRPEHLIHEHEENFLKQAIIYARSAYPNG